MRALLQRVKQASVSVDKTIVGQISAGWLILLGVSKQDTKKDIQYLIKKIVSLRAFSDGQGKLNLNILSIKGEFLVISQFTLYASYTKGKRPNFSDSAVSDDAKHLYDDFVSELKKHKLIVATGRFGAKMEVHMVGDGPVTFLLESP